MQVLSQHDIDEHQPLLKTAPDDPQDTDLDEQHIDVRSFLVACGANLYEYYDFALLGFFSHEISFSLFPDVPGATAIILLYSLFAVGFVARPFGGIVFGYFGDRYGRKSSLRMAMLLMSVPTFLTGCIPSYEYIGYWAPVILLLLRVLQGLSTGGENSSASIYIYESVPRNKRAFWLSIFGICSSGTLIASLSHVILQNTLTSDQMVTFGWRIPFFLGLGLFIFSLWAKNVLKTTETFSHLESSPYIHHNPITYVCSHNLCLLIQFVLISSIQHASAYLLFVFLPSFLSSDVMRGYNIDPDAYIDTYAYSINCINSVLFLPLCVLVGYLTDRYGAMPFLSTSAIMITFSAPFLFYGLAISRSPILDWFLQFLLVMSCVPMWGCIFFWYINVLLPDPRTRVTMYGVGYNLGASVFGGTASLIGASLVQVEGPVRGMVFTGIWMSALAIVSICCIWYIDHREKRLQRIDRERQRQRIGIGGDKSWSQQQLEGLKAGGRFTSTWYLKQLDPITEGSYETLPTTESAEKILG
eukprot:CAMPEP_0202693952 /NCGR_PEP_ID=MMETSP1385-20130828/7942_1 /ASSEMBLY_ACC=CAM_ASM_000861 /TAXON_ID=933848 /ORGANISM="Elphidium margaritaceum" /LENGTH=527 /DNA_ID=CAMNT_0049349715 /DNA_START=51 /DNA_END=1634 /DNA_ORIENTATION=+